MAGQDVSQWVGAEVTGVTVDDAGNNLVHLEFPDNCPMKFSGQLHGEHHSQKQRLLPTNHVPVATPRDHAPH